MASVSTSILIIVMCIVNVLTEQIVEQIVEQVGADVSDFVSPPFLDVAMDLYNNPEIASLLKDPEHYKPWGKAGVAYSVMYYMRNARLAVQYHSNPTELKIDEEYYHDIWPNVFILEMDLFSAFQDWFNHRNDDEKWKQFVRTVYDIFGTKLQRYLDYFSTLPSFPIKMAVFTANGVGPDFLTESSNDNIPNERDFNAKDPFVPTIDGTFPLIGFGSWPLKGLQCKDAVAKALKTGYRLIDTSENYNNEQDIGEAIKESGIDRKDILIASKLSYDRNYGEGVTTEAFKKTCENLGVDYMDVYMLHGAIGDKRRLRQAWNELETLYNKGKIKYLGVSNFGPRDMDQLLSYATVKPMFVQNKYDVFTQGQQTPWTPSIEAWAKNYNDNIRKKNEKPIIIQGYCLLNSWPHQVSAVKDKHVAWIANKYDVTPAQVLVRWALQHENMAILTRSSNEKRQLENLDAFDFEIDEVDMQLLNGLSTLFSPFDIDWMYDVYGQVTGRPQLKPAKVEL